MTGDFLFIHYGYDRKLKPGLTLHLPGSDVFSYFSPTGQSITLTFDTSSRACTGWHDLSTSQSYPCPDQAALPPQFDHCRHCQNKTGFNPAFYHAASVSPQQQARNAEPHFLYLAHFAPGVVKVGISWAQRGLRRLLDQGARSALIVKTYPTATLARQYEAKVAALPGISETLQQKTKHKLLGTVYDMAKGVAELMAVRERVADSCGISADRHEPVVLDPYYLTGQQITAPIILYGEQRISGNCLGMVGGTLITEQNGQQFGLGLSNLTGYRVTISKEVAANVHRPQQASLF